VRTGPFVVTAMASSVCRSSTPCGKASAKRLVDELQEVDLYCLKKRELSVRARSEPAAIFHCDRVADNLSKVCFNDTIESGSSCTPTYL